MKTQVWVYVVVAVLSIGAGVAIAGLPNSAPREPTIQPPTTTTTTLPTEENGSLFEPIVTSGVEAVEDDADDDADSTTTATESTAPETTVLETTTTEASTTTTAVPVIGRETLDVATANGAALAGVATATANRLETLGYVDVRALEGTEIFEQSVVFGAPGLGDAAQRLAADLGISPDLVFPIEDAPPVPSLLDEQLLVYLGRDANDL